MILVALVGAILRAVRLSSQLGDHIIGDRPTIAGSEPVGDQCPEPRCSLLLLVASDERAEYSLVLP